MRVETNRSYRAYVGGTGSGHGLQMTDEQKEAAKAKQPIGFVPPQPTARPARKGLCRFTR